MWPRMHMAPRGSAAPPGQKQRPSVTSLPYVTLTRDWHRLCWPCTRPSQPHTLVLKWSTSPLHMYMQTLPTRPAAPPGAATEFRNGLPLCTARSCGASAPGSPQFLRGIARSQEPISKAGPRNPPHAVLISVPVACMLALLVLAVGVLLHRHRRRDSTVKKAQMGGHNSSGTTDQDAAVAEPGLGSTAVRHPIQSALPHCPLCPCPSFTLLSGCILEKSGSEKRKLRPT